MIGVLLLVSRAIAARKLMRSGAHLLISGGNAAGEVTDPSVFEVVDLLLRDAASTWWAIALIIVGIAGSTTSGVLSLLL